MKKDEQVNKLRYSRIPQAVLSLVTAGLLFILIEGTALASGYFRGPPDIVITNAPVSPKICANDVGDIYTAFPLSGDLVVSRSSDGGQTWGAPIAIEQLEELILFGSSGKIACDDAGNVYVVWIGHLLGRPVIYFNVSQDFGQTWKQDPILLSTGDPATSFNRFPDLAHDDQGNIYVVWEDEGKERPGIYFNVSNDFGNTWLTSDLQLNQLSSEIRGGQQVVADDQGNIYVAFFAGSIGNKAIYLATSHDFGDTFFTEVPVNAGALDTSVPRIAADNTGHVIVYWVDNRNSVLGSGSDLFCNVSSDFGQTFLSNDIRINQTPPASVIFSSLTGMTVGCAGRVYAAWADSRDGWFHLFFNRSFDHGLTWEPDDVRLTFQNSSVQQNPRFAATRNGHVFAAWSYIGGKVYLNASCDDGATWSGELRLNQPSNSGRVHLAANNLGNAYVTWCVIWPDGGHFNWASPTVGLGIDGPTDPIRVPAGQGLTFDYDVTVRNNTTSPIVGLMGFLDATTPDGMTTPPFLGPRTFTLPASVERTRTLSLHIPASIPSGEYLISLRIAGAVTDQNHLCVIKE